MSFGLAASGLGGIARASANGKVVLAVVGIRSRGKELIGHFGGVQDCVIKYVVDVDARYLGDAAKKAEEKQGSRPEELRDFRVALADKDVDGIVIATPDHWHAPMSIEALKAGKHVYVEKPCGHNPKEGELLVAAAKKYGKLVQMGNQRRSTVVGNQLVREVQEEKIIGEVYYAWTWYANSRGPIGYGKVVDVPEYLDWDLWQGPAPRVEYRSNVHPYNWHWFWHWGTGEALNNGTHELDVARWAMGLNYPVKVTSVGGRWHYPGQDDWECYDTQQLTCEFGEGKAIAWQGLSSNNYAPEGIHRGVRLHGTEGTIVYDGNWYKVFDKDNKLVKEVGKQTEASGANTVDPGIRDNHAGNFVDGILGRSPISSPVEEGHKSVLLGHLGNIAARVGRTLHCDAKDGHIVGDEEAMGLWGRSYEPGWEVGI
jgi:predicted dehydrogenase